MTKQRDYGLRTVLLLVLWLAASIVASRGQDITSGYTFSSGEQNITHTKLNSVMSGAVINPYLITSKSATTTPDTSSSFLIIDPSTSNFKKTTLLSAFFTHDYLINGRSEKTLLLTNDAVLIYDAAAASYKRALAWNLLPWTTYPTLTNAGASDLWVVYSGGTTKAMSWTNLVQNLSTNPLIAQPQATNIVFTNLVAQTNLNLADQLLIFDSASGTNRKVSVATLVSNTIAGMKGSYQSLVIQNLATNQAVMTADEIVLRGTNGLAYAVTNVNLTNTVTSSGANGLDTGSVATNTWLYLYAIWNGTNLCSLTSTNPSNPTLPASYTYAARFGCLHVSTNLVIDPVYQVNSRVWTANTNLFTGNTHPLNNRYTNLTTAEQAIFAQYVPPIAKGFYGNAGSSSGSFAALMAVAGNISGVGAADIVAGVTSSSLDGFTVGVPFECPLITAQDFWWKAASTSLPCRINVTGYRL